MHITDKEKAEALAQAIYDAIDKTALAVEVARLLKEHGICHMKLLAEWTAKTTESE